MALARTLIGTLFPSAQSSAFVSPPSPILSFFGLTWQTVVKNRHASRLIHWFAGHSRAPLADKKELCQERAGRAARILGRDKASEAGVPSPVKKGILSLAPKIANIDLIKVAYLSLLTRARVYDIIY